MWVVLNVCGVSRGRDRVSGYLWYNGHVLVVLSDVPTADVYWRNYRFKIPKNVSRIYSSLVWVVLNVCGVSRGRDRVSGYLWYNGHVLVVLSDVPTADVYWRNYRFKIPKNVSRIYSSLVWVVLNVCGVSRGRDRVSGYLWYNGHVLVVLSDVPTADVYWRNYRFKIPKNVSRIYSSLVWVVLNVCGVSRGRDRVSGYLWYNGHVLVVLSDVPTADVYWRNYRFKIPKNVSRIYSSLVWVVLNVCGVSRGRDRVSGYLWYNGHVLVVLSDVPTADVYWRNYQFKIPKNVSRIYSSLVWVVLNVCGVSRGRDRVSGYLWYNGHVLVVLSDVPTADVYWRKLPIQNPQKRF